MHPEVIAANWQLIASGVALTLQIAVVALLIGTVLGVLVAVARTSAPAPIAALATGYVETMRNTPVLVQLLLIFLGLATYYFHNFWDITNPEEQAQQMAHFLKNVSMMGTMLFIMAVGAGPFSCDARWTETT